MDGQKQRLLPLPYGWGIINVFIQGICMCTSYSNPIQFIEAHNFKHARVVTVNSDDMLDITNSINNCILDKVYYYAALAYMYQHADACHNTVWLQELKQHADSVYKMSVFGEIYSVMHSHYFNMGAVISSVKKDKRHPALRPYRVGQCTSLTYM